MDWKLCIIGFCLLITHIRSQENVDPPEEVVIQAPTEELLEQAGMVAVPSPNVEKVTQSDVAIEVPDMALFNQPVATQLPTPDNVVPETVNIEVPTFEDFNQLVVTSTPTPTTANTNPPQTSAISAAPQENVNRPLNSATQDTAEKNVNKPKVTDTSSEEVDSEEFFASTFAKTLGGCDIFSPEEAQDFKELALIMKRSLGSATNFERAPPQVLKALADSFATAVAERTAADISRGDLYSKMTCVIQALNEAFLFTTGVSNSYFTNEVEKLIKAFFLRGDPAGKTQHKKHHNHKSDLFGDPSPFSDDLSSPDKRDRGKTTL